MSLIIINGSPRAKTANSKIIIDWVLSKIDKTTEVKEFYAVSIKKHQTIISQIKDNDTLLFVFPLYADSVPGVLKLFIEELEKIKDNVKDINFYAIVQSGFLGAKHSRAVERYLIYMAKYLGFNYLGLAIKPSGEGIRIKPAILNKKTHDCFVKLAEDINNLKPFNQEVLATLAGSEVPKLKNYKFGRKAGNIYFNTLLRKNKAYSKRFDHPYLEEK